MQILGLSVWFSATAVVPSLRAEWGFGPTTAGWLTASVQIGFAAGAVTSALLNLADRVRPQYLLAASAACAATCTAALAFFVHGVSAAIALRFAHWGRAGRCLPGGNETDGLVVRIRRSRALVRSPDRGADPRLRVPSPDQRSRAAALEDGDDHCRDIVRGRGRSSPSEPSCPGHTWTGGRSPRTPATRSPCSPSAASGSPMSATSATCGSCTPYGPGSSVFVLAGQQERGHAAAPSTGVIAFSAIGIAGLAGCSARRMGIGPRRSSPYSGDRAGDQRSLLRRLPVVLRRADCGFGPVLDRVGRLGHRRLRCLFRLAERDGGQTARRDGTDRADGDRLPAHRRDDPPRPRSRRPGRLAVRLPAARTWSGDRCRRDGSASWVPDIHCRT